MKYQQMIILGLCAAFVAAPTTSIAQTPSASTLPVGPPICLPTGQTALPSVATKLVKGARYVISCRVECDVLAFPDGLVEVEQKTGPRSWTAIFAGGTGDYEDREFTNPYLYALKPIGTGPLNLVVIPRGYKDKNEWVRALLEVDIGGPRPPPIPPPVPPPIPPPIPPAPVDPLWPALLTDYSVSPNPEAARTLASYYRVAADMNGAPGSVSDSKFATVKAFTDPFSLLVASKVPTTAIRPVRDELAKDFQGKFGTNLNIPLTDPLRGAIAAQFLRCAGLLEALAK